MLVRAPQLLAMVAGAIATQLPASGAAPSADVNLAVAFADVVRHTASDNGLPPPRKPTIQGWSATLDMLTVLREA